MAAGGVEVEGQFGFVGGQRYEKNILEGLADPGRFLRRLPFLKQSRESVAIQDVAGSIAQGDLAVPTQWGTVQVDPSARPPVQSAQLGDGDLLLPRASAENAVDPEGPVHIQRFGNRCMGDSIFRKRQHRCQQDQKHLFHRLWFIVPSKLKIYCYFCSVSEWAHESEDCPSGLWCWSRKPVGSLKGLTGSNPVSSAKPM